MIAGVVSAYLEALVRLTLRGPGGQEEEIETVIDTGFDAALSLPPTRIAALGLPWRRCGRALLADGSESLFDIYEATIVWDGTPRRIAVDAADTDPLLGMALLYGYELTLQAVEGGRVIIQALPCFHSLPFKSWRVRIEGFEPINGGKGY